MGKNAPIRTTPEPLFPCLGSSPPVRQSAREGQSMDRAWLVSQNCISGRNKRRSAHRLVIPQLRKANNLYPYKANRIRPENPGSLCLKSWSLKRLVVWGGFPVMGVRTRFRRWNTAASISGNAPDQQSSTCNPPIITSSLGIRPTNDQLTRTQMKSH